MIRILIKGSGSIKTLKKEIILDSKTNFNVINEKITDIESLYNTLPSGNPRNKEKYLIKFLKNFSKEQKLNKFLFEKIL